jgi:hypothetical protein
VYDLPLISKFLPGVCNRDGGESKDKVHVRGSVTGAA